VITRLDLQLFKCFELLHLPLGPLTLLSGGNASGKSSVLQALVLLHQTMRWHEWSQRLMLNGEAIRLGTVADVVDKVHGRSSFEIGLVDGKFSYEWSFAGDRSDMSMTVERVAVDGKNIERPGIDGRQEPYVLRFLLPLAEHDGPTIAVTKQLRDLTYITAERVGPREVYDLEDRQTAPVVGPVGEHAVSVLHWGRDERVLPELALEAVPPTRLRQVEARMGTIFPGCALVVQQVPQANAVTLGLRTSDDTDFHRPIHVGFGLTQVFPIIVAALSAHQADILLIENPEVHLHPAGQAQMGQFLADVARAGVQVIVETHSDHILNGIRRSVKAGRLPPEDVTLHFFKPRSAEAAQVVTPVLDRFGNIDSWPSGFFDQFDKDMNYFAGWE
jgi:predicted ATPase